MAASRWHQLSRGRLATASRWQMLIMWSACSIDFASTSANSRKREERRTLAIRIYRLDVSGDPVYEQLGGVLGHTGPNGGDGKILSNVTMYQTAGWDWMPSVRDRNMGIWQHVWVETTSPVAVRDPASFVDLKWTPGQDAPVKVRGYLDNRSTQPVNTDITVRIEPNVFGGSPVEFHQSLTAASGRDEFILLPPDLPELILHNP